MIKRIKSEFPTATADQTKFLQKNKQFVTTLHKMRNSSKDLDKFFDKTCPICEEKLVKWPHKTKDSYVISLCEIMKIKYEARFCTRCKFLSYFDLYRVGLVPVHNKVMFIYFILNAYTLAWVIFHLFLKTIFPNSVRHVNRYYKTPWFFSEFLGEYSEAADHLCKYKGFSEKYKGKMSPTFFFKKRCFIIVVIHQLLGHQ